MTRFPKARLRRLRSTETIRALVRETALSPAHLVAPLFVHARGAKRRAIPSMPGQFRLSVEEAARQAKRLAADGVGAVLLFGLPEKKDAEGTGARDPEGVVQRAVQAVKQAAPGLPVITDVCLCEYTDHGHCGVLKGNSKKAAGPAVDNDATLTALAEAALSHVEAGADWVAPSAMMDGQVRAIRRRLDEAGYTEVPIMSYSAKYASALYGPFREAVESAPRFGDRRGYQMDPANAEEALREVALDIEEGADIVMVKPALGFLDIVRRVKDRFGWPTAAYQVSGEYALIRAAAARGWVDEKRLVLETAVSLRRAGADILITYDAARLARWL